MDLQLTSMFEHYEACALRKDKKAELSKMAMAKGKRLFINISSLSTAIMGSKKHWLLMLKDSTEYVSSYFLKERSELKHVMIPL